MKRGNKFILINFVLLLSIFMINSEDIKSNFPDTVKIEEEFDFEIELIDFEDNVYALKFDIKEGTKNSAQRFWQGTWKSTHYWLYEAFKKNEKKINIKLKMIDGNGKTNFNIKIKNSSGNLWTFNEDITIINNNKESKNIKDNKKKEKSDKEEDKDNDREKKSNGKDGNIKEKIDLNWDKDKIINGEEFNIEIDSDIKDKDVKLWIEYNDEIISEIYDNENNEWKSGRYYLNNFNDKFIRIRIKEEFNDFNGKAALYFKTREGTEYKDEIVVLRNEEKSNDTIKNKDEEQEVNNKLDDNIENENKDNENKIVETGNTIKLGTLNENIIYGNKKNLLYESKTVKIKKYSIFVFVFFIILILILWRKL